MTSTKTVQLRAAITADAAGSNRGYDNGNGFCRYCGWHLDDRWFCQNSECDERTDLLHEGVRGVVISVNGPHHELDVTDLIVRVTSKDGYAERAVGFANRLVVVVPVPDPKGE